MDLVNINFGHHIIGGHDAHTFAKQVDQLRQFT
jgi:hypothetical protein